MASVSDEDAAGEDVSHSSSVEMTETEPTKSSLRIQTWNKIAKDKYGIGEIFYHNPGFVNSYSAAARLVETDEFQNAVNLQINCDRGLQAVALQALVANKVVFLPGTSESEALFLKVLLPNEAVTRDAEGNVEINKQEEFSIHEISLANKVHIDMILIGSVLVSRDGHRIGNGKGVTDLNMGLLIEIGSITQETLIVTLVHESQVVDTLSANLFEKYDTPVDLIVTPSEVIRVGNRPPRPVGIYWELLTKRHLVAMPVLQALKGDGHEKKDEQQDEHDQQTEEDIGGTVAQHNEPKEPNNNDNTPPSGAIRRRPPKTLKRTATNSNDAEQRQRIWRIIRYKRKKKQEAARSGNAGKLLKVKPRPAKNTNVAKQRKNSLDPVISPFKMSCVKEELHQLCLLWKAQTDEPTKRSLRVQTWKKIQDNKCSVGINSIFNRIPGFVDSDKAALLLTETEEFKRAQNVKVNIDRALHAVKLQTLIAGKALYLPGTRDSSALYLKVDVPDDATEEQKKDILHVQDVHQHRTEVSLENKVIFDLVVIGSVLVSRDGYRIGRGNGFADLDIGLLIEIGSITPDTVIATVVHDVQVANALPLNLFQKYDTPVDLIVTPTEVIRVEKRLPRPAGIFWELLSERRLKIVPALQALKESLEKSGKVIVLKEEDTDIEQNQSNRSRRRGQMRRRYGRRNNRRANSQTDTEQQGDNQQQPQKRNTRRNRRFTNRRRRTTKSEGDQSVVEGGKSQERKPAGGGGGAGGQRKQQKPRKNRPTRDFCIKLSNLTRDIRVKDLKTELRKRECTPLYISWKGQFGKCYLHFGNRNGTPSTEDDINNVLKALNDLSLTVTTGGGAAAGNASCGEGDGAAPVPPPQTKTVNVNVELIKFDEKKADAAAGEANEGAERDVAAGGDAGIAAARIESVDTTTV